MVLEPVAIRSGDYSPCRFESYTLRLRNIYIKQKTRNLTRIPIFAMIGGVRTCDFCRNKKKIIDGKGNLVLFGAENNMIFDNSDGKEVAGAVKINFCPICGRKLVEE